MQEEATNEQEVELKLQFDFQSKVEFGKGVYVIGNLLDLGAWSINNSTRLTWDTYTNRWRVELIVKANDKQQIEYKYFITDYDNPENSEIKWEESNNKVIIVHCDELGREIILHDEWNGVRHTYFESRPVNNAGRAYIDCGYVNKFKPWDKPKTYWVALKVVS